MLKPILTNIIRLWVMLIVVASCTVLLARLQPNHTLLYLEHAWQETSNIIWMLDTTQGVRYPLVERANLAAFDLAPDGRKLLYQVDSGHAAAVYLLSLDSTQHERLTGVNIECPRWSPDSQTIAYQNYDDYSLYLLDVQSGTSTLFLYLGSGIARCSFDWTPDGLSLVHTIWLSPNRGPAEVVETSISTREPTLLFTTQRPVRHLTTAPDGASVVFNGQIYATIMNLATHESVNIAYYSYTFSASWSPTQEYLAFGYQKPLVSARDAIVRGIAVIDSAGNIQFQEDVGTISHVTWWLRQ